MPRRSETGPSFDSTARRLLPASLYVDTAPPGPDTLPLARDVRTGTVVIGAGFTGLSAALHLAAAGRAVMVIDAGEPGWGASGRNGGQVNPGLKTMPSDVERDFGGHFGRRLAVHAWNAPDVVFALIDRYRIDCAAVRGGTIRAATAESQLAALDRLTGECRARGGDVEWLDAAAMQARTGTSRYLAGMIDRRGGQVNPLAYARGLASAAQAEGAVIHSGTSAAGMRRQGALWEVTTPHGVIRADHVVLATNGYSDGLWPGLAQSIVPVYSAIIATQPLPERLTRAILASREVLYELGEITAYYRIDDDGRLLMGGRSASRSLCGPNAFPFLRELAHRIWPGLAGTEWTYGWNGQLAMTMDHYPHWHEPETGLIACLGYNGRGVAMATMLGRDIARRVLGAGPQDLLLPITPIKPIPLHRLWPLGVAARVAVGRWRDSRATEAASRGKSKNP